MSDRIKRVLRCWWGNEINTMSANRKRCFGSILMNSGIENIELITPHNYKQYELDEHPIHEAFDYLSEVHKGDYLRAYISHFYGGCWTDIKYIDHDWNKYFDTLDEHPEMLGIGYRQMLVENGVYKTHEPDHPGYNLLGMAHYIIRERTEPFYNCLKAMEAVLTNKLALLKAHPGTVHPMIRADGARYNNFKRLPDHLREYPYPLKWLEISEKWYGAQRPFRDKLLLGMPAPHNMYTGFEHR